MHSPFLSMEMKHFVKKTYQTYIIIEIREFVYALKHVWTFFIWCVCGLFCEQIGAVTIFWMQFVVSG